MLKLSLLLTASTAAAICLDEPTFTDEFGQPCSTYAGLTSCLDAVGLSPLGLSRVLENCQATCNSCVKAADFCEIGSGGDLYSPATIVDNFDFVDEPFLTDTCMWQDTPSGLRQATNAWGNTPGENQVMGCMAILKTVEYTDFIMEVEAWHDDNDASGIIFGYQDANTFYKTMMFNDDWLDNPTDSVNGPFLKISKRNANPCLAQMTPANDCYDLLAYTARDDSQDVATFPRGRLTSHDWVPSQYVDVYDDFKYHNADNRPVRYTLIVYQGEARVYFMSENNKWVGTWTDLPADYAGGRVGLFMSAHQANYQNINIVDLSAGATPLTSHCKELGATCDTTLGLCLGGPSPAPTAFPTPAPTYLEICPEPFRHAVSEFCPNPVGGNVVTYDVTVASNWEFLDQAPVSEPCDWDASAAGLIQQSNAWGNVNSQLLLGCIALIGDPAVTYTDFIAEYEAVHLDNDAWGFVFGFNSMLDHYTAHTHNDAWPAAAIDGVNGPFTQIRKTTGLPCLELMNASNVCYETLGYTDSNGYSDYSGARDTGPRGKEYEYTHAYAASAEWQPHKITLIVKGQEARLIYKSPDSFVDTPINNVRMGNRYQAAMTFDLKGYTGGRVGIFMSAHQMIVNNFKITDISDDANLPTDYCGGDAGAFCDSGATGLCMAVAAGGVCEGAVNPTVYDTTDLTLFEFVEDPTLGSACTWVIGPNGNVRQSSNANRYEGALLGCNAMLAEEYTDFVAEMWMDNQDNDAIGFNFGWKAADDFFRVHKINDQWNNIASDYVAMPVFKMRRRLVGTSCAGWTNETNPCFETIAFVDVNGPWHQDIAADAVTPAGECGYSQTYLQYDQAALSKMYLIVKDNQVRATYESPLSRRQVTVMNFDLSKYNYAGGRVGIFMSAHQAEFYEITVGSLVGAGAVTQFCDGDPCSARTGRCLGSPTVSPTPQPTPSPTVFPTPNVAANEYCQGPVSATATTVVDTTDISQFLLQAHPLLTADCAWSAAADGLTQSSEAWGNAPGDNTLMGCMAMYQAQTFTDFIAEIDVTHIDNDGWGIVFGYNAVDDQYLGIAMNDRWPLPAADGVSGPFLKMKKHNGKPVLQNMDASNTCFDKISHLDLNGFDRVSMEGSTGSGLPKEYSARYPYARGDQFADTKITLIVVGGEARLYYPTPNADMMTPVNNIRQSQTATSTWTFDLQGYTGGMVGVFTYAHQATFSNWKITDLTDPSAITDYCDGHPDMYCDNQRGDESTGLCMGVPLSDVCEAPVGPNVMQIDTGDLSLFDYVDDPVLTQNCSWALGNTGNLYQSTNAFHSDTIQLGCNAILKDMTFTDFIAQVDIDNDDNDAVGFDFGWKSFDDHFRLHKMNDAWPNPAADSLPGPILKVRRKIPGRSCENAPYNATTTCYQTISFVDQFGSYHDGMPVGAVAPFEYARTYIPYSQSDIKRLVLMIRDSKLRVLYEDVDQGKFVGAFAFDLTPYDYTGGQIGFYLSAHQAQFSNFLVGELSGANAVTQFCNGGLCDERTGLCTTQPTFNPTSRVGDVAAAAMCPNPVGGNTVAIDVTNTAGFSFVDQTPITEPCNWIADADGLRQTSNAWGNDPGDNTLMGCIALIGSQQYTDFMIEMTATHEDDDAWGFVFGYDGMGTEPAHFIATVNNDKWPDPAMDGVMGPFAKIKVTNGLPCLPQMDNTTACYDTISYADYRGRFVVDGEMITDFPGEYARTYPYKVDTVWPERKLTLIVKDGEARLLVLGPGADNGAPVNNLRLPTKVVSTWTYGLDAAGYTGGQIGIFLYAHQLTISELTVTDLSDDANLPTDYCGGNATCTTGGTCVAVPVSDVCEDPVGATRIDTTTLASFDFIEDELALGLTQDCAWSIADFGRGSHLYQGSNAYGVDTLDKLLMGCNAIYRGPSYTDFIMQFDADNYDNDAPGIVFGWKSPTDHFKAHKIIDDWPNPAADWVPGPNIKVRRRIPERSCDPQPMNETNNCYETIAFSDNLGVGHQAMPMDAVQPWQYSTRYFDYEIGRGVANSDVRFVLMVRGQELRVYFTSSQRPELKIGAFAFDMASNYDGGRVGVWTFAHQVQYFDIRIAPLTGTGAATEFCANGGSCNTITGLCE